ncbi:4-fold beta flower protein [uncultured Methylobacterium sp.]|uniref:4-fold beta flower protein n=1 Tax=uncultured Methylobacterium sp. TaxID=157278 RepID=UPI0035C9848C
MIEFFDREGRPSAFCDDGRAIYHWDGRPAAIIDDDKVFSYSGRFVGWFSDGWISDAAGGRLLYEFDAVGGPVKPPRGTRTAKGQRGTKPPQGAREAAPPHPGPSTVWSEATFSGLVSSLDVP